MIRLTLARHSKGDHPVCLGCGREEGTGVPCPSTQKTPYTSNDLRLPMVCLLKPPPPPSIRVPRSKLLSHGPWRTLKMPMTAVIYTQYTRTSSPLEAKEFRSRHQHLVSAVDPLGCFTTGHKGSMSSSVKRKRDRVTPKGQRTSMLIQL